MDASAKMEKSYQLLIKQFSEVSLHHSAGAVGTLKVSYYGSLTPIQQLATVSSTPNRIIIKPYDPACLKDMESAIHKANLGFGFMKERSTIILTVPNPSMEQRERLATRVKGLAVEAKVAIRNIRRDAKKELDKEVSEDLADRGKKGIQEVTDSYIEKVDSLTEKKVSALLKP